MSRWVKRLQRARNKLRALKARFESRTTDRDWRVVALAAAQRLQRRRAKSLVFDLNRRLAFRRGWRRLWDGDVSRMLWIQSKH